ncbi:YcxB family protein [Blastopirellula retiformator]|uniref:YcxB-like protein domain-containing protein n=1 Tax=Blastopirellula retiformator TaxID=2527970 RepID=A0A5C5V2U7_9BACT|nr:YcxB family protein [Blastopirellula retiformator]TWT32936.1 hypothetical protein Enr8_27520 [Blastopirellula retiformator]
MDVEFETSKADLAAFQEAAPPLSYLKQYAVFLCLFLIFTGPAFLPYFASGRTIAGVVFLSIFSAIWIAILYQANRHERRKLITCEHLQLRLDPRGLVEREDHATTWVSWSLIEKTNAFPNVIQILFTSNAHILIPARAFASEEETSRFVQLAEQYRVAASELPATPFPSPTEEFYPAWAAGITQAIEYQNNADELAYVVANGVPPLKRPNIYLSSLHSLAWLIGAALVLAWGMANPPIDTNLVTIAQESRRFDMPMYIASVIWFVVSLVGSSTAIRWYNRSRMSTTFLTPRRLTMTAKGYLLQTAAVTHCGQWKNLKQVDQNAEFLAFKNQIDQHICVVPKKAFATPQLAQEFADEAQLYWQDAQQPDETELGDDVIQAELADGDNPYRSPHA